MTDAAAECLSRCAALVVLQRLGPCQGRPVLLCRRGCLGREGATCGARESLASHSFRG